MLSKTFRKFHNFVLLSFTFRNWAQVMRYALSVYMPFTDTCKTRLLVLRKGQKLKVRLANTYDLGSILEVYQRNVYTPSFLKIPDKPVIIDIGASIGDFSVFCGSTFKGARVLSYEPTAEAFKILEENVELNNLKDKIKPYCLGISGMNHKINISGEQYSSISIRDIFDENRIERCDLLKMDCEGMEYDILLNTSEKLLRLINTIVMECHTMDSGEDLPRLITYLTQAKFEVTTTRITDHNVCYLYAMRK